MGTLMGHILPGSFFLAFAIWWMFSILKRYYQAKLSRNGGKYKSTATFPCPCSSKFPLEAMLKVFVVTVGITGETITGFKGGRWAHWGNAQHISMFLFFGFTGVVDILYFYKCNLPPGLDYASAAIAFFIEGLLFAYHLHGRTPMDVQIHVLLLYAIVGCIICVLLEAKYPNNVIPAIGRAYFTFVQGSWFYQVGFILYPPPGMSKWDEENHEQMMITTLLFTVHFAIAFVVTLIMNFAVWSYVRRSQPLDINGRSQISYKQIATNVSDDETQALKTPLNGTVLRTAIDGSSEDEV